jgi:hypothetical protein
MIQARYALAQVAAPDETDGRPATKGILMSDRRRDGAPSSPQGRPATFRIAGFPVHASPTSFVLFGLITYTAALGLLPAAAPGASSTAYWIAGAIAAALVMASLLLHELAHAFVARRHGLVVESVTFWLFGGLARFTSQAESPRAEWRIAAIGPLVDPGMSVEQVGAFLAGERERWVAIAQEIGVLAE